MTRKPPYAVEYRHEGRLHSFTLWASSWEDAERRVNSIARNAQVVGSDVTEYAAGPVALPFAAIWVRLVCWWRNWGRE